MIYGSTQKETGREYKLNDEITIQSYKGKIHGVIVGEEDADGLIQVQTDQPINGKVVNTFRRDILDSLVQQGQRNVLNEEPRQEPPHKDKSDFWTCLGCSIIVLIALGWFGYYMYTAIQENKQRVKEKELLAQHKRDSIAHVDDSIAHVKDSINAIINSKEYRDSAALAERIEQEKLDKKIVVMVGKDGVYHYMTQCFDVSDMNKIRFMSRFEAEKRGYVECSDCHYNDDDYVYFEDVFDYINDNYSTGEIIEYFDITISDLDF